MQSALFIGRFQPFHKGHLAAVKKILEKNERVIIAIGSAEKNLLPHNPLTASERFQIIEESLKEAKIPPEKYIIIPVQNINNFSIWAHHINTFVPPYTRIYTGSDIVKTCFKYAQIDTEIISLDRYFKLSATKVREVIIKDKDMKKFLTPACIKLLKKWDIKTRLKVIDKAVIQKK